MTPRPVDKPENLSHPAASLQPTQSRGGGGGGPRDNTKTRDGDNGRRQQSNSEHDDDPHGTSQHDDDPHGTSQHDDEQPNDGKGSTKKRGNGRHGDERRNNGQRGTGWRGNSAGGERRTRKRRSGRWTAWAFLAPVVLYLIAFYAYPLYRNLDLSLRHYTVRSFVQGGAPFNGLDNYQTVIQDPTFGPALAHTLLFTLLSLLFQFSIGMALAVFFRQNFPLSATLRALFLVPWLLPLIVSASTWSWMLNSDSGVVNWTLALAGIHPVNWLTSPHWALISVTIANVWIGIPFNLAILYSGLQTIPAALDEAAALDGANGWQRFWRITFPLLRPVSTITLLLGLVYTLKVFDIIWIMTRGGPTNASTTLATWSYKLGFGNLLPQFGPGAAVGNLLIIMALLAGLLYIRIQRKQNS